MKDKLKLFVSSWKTTLPGMLAALCASGEYFDLLPESWKTKAVATCTFLVAIGLIAAKDADKSNAPVPSASAVKIS